MTRRHAYSSDLLARASTEQHICRKSCAVTSLLQDFLCDLCRSNAGQSGRGLQRRLDPLPCETNAILASMSSRPVDITSMITATVLKSPGQKRMPNNPQKWIWGSVIRPSSALRQRPSWRRLSTRVGWRTSHRIEFGIAALSFYDISESFLDSKSYRVCTTIDVPDPGH